MLNTTKVNESSAEIKTKPTKFTDFSSWYLQQVF